MGDAALYRRLLGSNPCSVCTPYKYTLPYNLKEK
jgi:hypothetical protein